MVVHDTPSANRGSVATTSSHLPFGGLESESAKLGPNGDPEVEALYRFTGKELERGLGYHYFGARYYNPALGRWLSVDPAMLATKREEAIGRVNSSYVYAGNQVYIVVDPDGRDDILIIYKAVKTPEMRRDPKRWQKEKDYERFTRTLAEEYKRNMKSKGKEVHIIDASSQSELRAKIAKATSAIQARKQKDSSVNLEKFVVLTHGAPGMAKYATNRMLTHQEARRLAKTLSPKMKEILGRSVTAFFISCDTFKPVPSTKAQRKALAHYMKALLSGKAELRSYLDFGGREERKPRTGYETEIAGGAKPRFEIESKRRGNTRKHHASLYDVLNDKKYTGKVIHGRVVDDRDFLMKPPPSRPSPFTPAPPPPTL